MCMLETRQSTSAAPVMISSHFRMQAASRRSWICFGAVMRHHGFVVLISKAIVLKTGPYLEDGIHRWYVDPVLRRWAKHTPFVQQRAEAGMLRLPHGLQLFHGDSRSASAW